MSIVIITGANGLVGSEAVSFFSKKKYKVIGIDNNLRKFFFGEDGSTSWIKRKIINSILLIENGILAKSPLLED